MRYSYDLHMHSCLSPCGDMDMTPNNIVNMACLLGLDIIAVSDHNTARNPVSYTHLDVYKRQREYSEQTKSMAEFHHKSPEIPNYDPAGRDVPLDRPKGVTCGLENTPPPNLPQIRRFSFQRREHLSA